MSVLTDYTQAASTSTYLKELTEASGKVTNEDFLRLFTTQLTTQDPLNPMQDLDFTSQLAQLQALSEQTAMTKSMQAMRIDTQLQAGTAMIGKYVSGLDSSGTVANGLVQRVTQSDGNVFVELSSGEQIEVSSISNVWNDAGSMLQDLANAGQVIDMWVEAGIDAATGESISGIVEKVLVVDGQVMLKLYGGKSVSWDQVTELRMPTQEEVYHFLPDEVRHQIEKAQSLLLTHVTMVDEDGKRFSGIVRRAQLNESTKEVFLELYSGEVIAIGGLIEGTGTSADPRMPTKMEAAENFTGLWAIGFDDDGNQVAGLVAKVGEDTDGLFLVLHDGTIVHYGMAAEIRTATDDDMASIES